MTSSIRFARPDEVQLIYQFIKDLSIYEKMEDQMVTTPEELYQALFVHQRAEVIFLLEQDKPVGFALLFHNFSTFVGKAGLYLEDLFVYPSYRGKGYGKALFLYLVNLAVERGCGRMEWSCLNWNTPSIDFYRSLGAIPMSDWTVYRLTEPQLKELSSKA